MSDDVVTMDVMTVGGGPPYFDDITGEQLPDDEVHAAERQEMKLWARFGVTEPAAYAQATAAGGEIVRTRWVRRRKPNGQVKCRLVAQDFNLGQPRDTFAATPNMVVVRLLLYYACRDRLDVCFGDLTGAFLHAASADLGRRPLYLVPPKNYWEAVELWHALRVVYGYREGPRLFQEHVAATLEKRGTRRMKGDACMFRFKSCLIVVHVDDLIVAGRVADREELTRILHEEFEIKISEVMGSEWCRFWGCEWRQLVDGFEARIPPKYFKLIREG
jgi:hypothetical protein